MADNVETAKDFGTPPEGTVARWLAEIKAYKKVFDQWEKRSDKVVKRYRDEPLTDNQVETTSTRDTVQKNFNIFWSNVQTLRPALLSRTPKMMARRRNRDRDPISLAAGSIAQRGLGYLMDRCDYEEEFKAALDDYLLTARGQVWVRYEPVYGEERRADLPVTLHEDGQTFLGPGRAPLSPGTRVTDAGDGTYHVPGGGETYRPVVEEKVYVDHLHWRDFGHSVAPRWKLVTAVWKRVEMTRDELVERFGKEKGQKVNLTRHTGGLTAEEAATYGDVFKRGEVYEIWDKLTRKVYWISEGYAEGPLDELDDPLHLQDFFPCPKPLYATTTTNTLVPVPDYLEYQAQATQLDVLTQRIDKLTTAMRVVGAYDGSFPQLENILRGTENTLIATDNWAMFAEHGGIPGSISFLPIKEVAEVIIRLTETRNQVKQDLYEVTGMSDLVRGQSEASTSATAERIKGKFVSLRLQNRQKEVEKFIRQAMRLVAEIMVEHFDEGSLVEISNWAATANARAAGDQAQAIEAAALKLLRDDRLRTFRIDIETDTTVLQDDEFEKQTRTEFLTAVSQFLQQAMPAGDQYPEIRPLLAEMLMYGVRGFHKGSELEEVFERTLEELSTSRQQSQQRTSEHQKQLADSQATIQKLQLQAQSDQQSFALKQADQQFQQQYKLQELALKKMELEAQLAGEEADRELKRQELMVKYEDLELKRDQQNTDNTLRRDEVLKKLRVDLLKLRGETVPKDELEKAASELTDLDGDEAALAVNPSRIVEMVSQMQAQQTELINELSQRQQEIANHLAAVSEQQLELARLISTPKRLVRDPQTNQIMGAELDHEGQLAQLNPQGTA